MNISFPTDKSFIGSILTVISIIFLYLFYRKLKYKPIYHLNELESKVLMFIKNKNKTTKEEIKNTFKLSDERINLILSNLKLNNLIDKNENEITYINLDKEKGQASIEYLMTYGWAILVLAIVITVLFLNGFINPKGNVKQFCLLPPQIGCSNFISYLKNNQNIVMLNLTNNLGYKAKICLTLTYKTKSTHEECKNIEEGDSAIYTLKFKDLLPPKGDLAQYKITINYIPLNSGNTYHLYGNLLAVVEGGK